MLKTACTITGDNYKSVALDTPASKKKIIALAMAVMVPTLIWLINGFMLAYQVLHTGLGWAIFIAFFCASLIFVIEKLIIMANGNGWLTVLRISIGLAVALLGSVAVDEVIFKDDIDIGVAHLKQFALSEARKNQDSSFQNLNELSALNKELFDARESFNNAEASALSEADGSSGTGTRGMGNVTNLKNQKAVERKADLDKLINEKQKLLNRKDSANNKAAETASASFNENGLLIRIKALFHTIGNDNYMMFIYCLFTFLMFLFEFLVVILKLTWKKTNYERKIEMIEEIGVKRIEFLNRKDSPLSDPGIYLPQFEKARSAINRRSGFFN